MATENMYSTGIHQRAHSLGKDGRFLGEKRLRNIPSNTNYKAGKIRPDPATQSVEGLYSSSTCQTNPPFHPKIKYGREYGKADHSAMASSVVSYR
jgi:hypothetical protein